MVLSCVYDCLVDSIIDLVLKNPMSKTALVVDDSKSARFALRKFLEGFDYTVEVAEDANQACQRLVDWRPDVIFMDHIMPGIDGFEALRMLKADPKTSSIPVVLCSSNEGEAFCAEARACGATSVLPKPPSPQQLQQILASLSSVRAALYVVEPPDQPAISPQAIHREPSAMQRLMATIAPPSQEAVKPGPVMPLPVVAHAGTSHPKVHPLREPAVTIQQAVMKTLRDSLPPDTPAEPVRIHNPGLPPMHPLTGSDDAATALLMLREEIDTRLRGLRQEIAAELSALSSQISGFDSHTHDEKVRQIATEVTKVHTNALASSIEQHLATLHSNLDSILHAQNERIEQLLQHSRQTAAEEAERTVMNAAQRIADQMAESIIKTLGPQISNIRRL